MVAKEATATKLMTLGSLSLLLPSLIAAHVPGGITTSSSSCDQLVLFLSQTFIDDVVSVPDIFGNEIVT